MDINYIMGLIATDGCTRERKFKKPNADGVESSFNCELEMKDEQIISDVANYFNIEYQFRERTINKKQHTFYKFYLSNDKLADKWKYLINEKAKLYEYYESLNEYEKNEFMRGMFDGDGTVCIDARGKLKMGFSINSKHQSILNIITEYLSENDVHFTNYFDKRGKGSYFVGFWGKKSGVRMYELLYKKTNSKLWLSRKKEMFEKYFNNVGLETIINSVVKEEV